jgi:hypothetical protein
VTGKSDQITESHSPERKYRRFKLCCPVLLKFPPESLLSELRAMSRNVSIGGLLLDVPSRIPQHSSVSFTLTVQGDRLVRPILLAGEGKVVRVEPQPRRKFAVAVECSRPITQIERYLPSPGD